MKKAILIHVVVLLLSTTAFAQKKYGPVAGQFATSLDATPFVDLLGNAINGNETTPANFVNSFGLYIKLYETDMKAYRLGVNLNLSSNSSENTSETTHTEKNTAIEVLGGIEYRHGKKKVQAFYGPFARIGYGSGSINDDYKTNTQDVETTLGKTFKIGLGGFAGAEMFLSDQITIGAEFNLALNYESTGFGERKTSTNTSKTGYSTSDFSFGFGSNASFIPSGKLFFSVYF